MERETSSFRSYGTGYLEEVLVMASAFVIVSFGAVLVAKWRFYAKYSKNHR